MLITTWCFFFIFYMFIFPLCTCTVINTPSFFVFLMYTFTPSLCRFSWKSITTLCFFFLFYMFIFPFCSCTVIPTPSFLLFCRMHLNTLFVISLANQSLLCVSSSFSTCLYSFSVPAPSSLHLPFSFFASHVYTLSLSFLLQGQSKKESAYSNHAMCSIKAKQRSTEGGQRKTTLQYHLSRIYSSKKWAYTQILKYYKIIHSDWRRLSAQSKCFYRILVSCLILVVTLPTVIVNFLSGYNMLFLSTLYHASTLF